MILINHVLVPLYYPSSNGQSERMVQSYKKKALRRLISSGGPWKHHISSYLLRQHVRVPVSGENTSGQASPTLSYFFKKNAKSIADSSLTTTQYSIDDSVYIRNFSSREPWIPLVVVGPSFLHLQSFDESTHQRHLDHIRRRLKCRGTITTSTTNY